MPPKDELQPAPALTVAHNLPPDDQAGTVPIKTHYAGTIFARLDRYKRDKGLPYHQDIIRLAVVKFLEQNGY